MSTIIMSQCWPLEGMSIAQKAVLISLADNANDQGVCWPSIATIARRVCASDRAVQNAIKWLESAKVVAANRANGRHTSYTLTPAAYSPPKEMHPEGNAPAKQIHPTPAGDSGDPRTGFGGPPNEVPTNRKEPSVNRKGTVIGDGDAAAGVSSADSAEDDGKPLTIKDLVDEGIPRQIAKDWMAVRKGKKQTALTPTAWAAVKREADKAGITVTAAVTHAVEAGWAGFKAKWLANEGAAAAASGTGAGLNKQEQLEQRNRAVAERLAAATGGM
ncbi:helix-turn-helix domain-containing protein [Pandoraea sp. SD6-2]|uniref:helix-turn-helix domain-containing protein n=1 Tax=Pandoraea sp. SD6-2 TaxID=1286093 RepID=UPI0003310BF7|nr:helix-turn-helix domain-containing protein [Pandoraea sp. SD6-2]EON13422.1 hypothetical protein C266_11215 [Pandoraea sp. SD6-2]